DRFRLSPAYQATALFNRAVGAKGWTAGGLFNDKGVLVSRFDGPSGAHSVFVLNRSSTPHKLHVHGLLPDTEYHVPVWNRDDDGQITTQHPLTTHGDVGTVSLRPQRMVVLLTNPLVPTP